MTFDEWWNITKPAECEKLKEYFNEAYQLGFSHGYKNCMEVCRNVANSGPDYLWGHAAMECEREIKRRLNMRR